MRSFDDDDSVALHRTDESIKSIVVVVVGGGGISQKDVRCCAESGDDYAWIFETDGIMHPPSIHGVVASITGYTTSSPLPSSEKKQQKVCGHTTLRDVT